jgi:CheY-like chemotaxis protein
MPAPDQTSRSAAAPRILLVEDDFLIALTLETDLKEDGYEIVGVADTADAAVRIANEHRPDLVIMDIRLVGPVDGIEAARRIRQDTGIRCIFATAHADGASRARAQAANPLAWLQKPYSRSTLIETVEGALRQLG